MTKINVKREIKRDLKEIKGKEFTAFYCKESFSKELVAKIEEDDIESLKKILENSMVSLEDYNNFRDYPTESNKTS